MEVTNNIKIEDARIIWRNFSGKPSKFNQYGFRTFTVLLPQGSTEPLIADGWNVKWLEPREEGDERQAHLEVKVQYGRIPPKVVTVSGKSRNKTLLTEETIGMLDYAVLETVDLIIRPYNWEVNGKTGVKAYLKTMYAVLEEDEFEAKYATLGEGDDGETAF